MSQSQRGIILIILSAKVHHPYPSHTISYFHMLLLLRAFITTPTLLHIYWFTFLFFHPTKYKLCLGQFLVMLKTLIGHLSKCINSLTLLIIFVIKIIFLLIYSSKEVQKKKILPSERTRFNFSRGKSSSVQKVLLN